MGERELHAMSNAVVSPREKQSSSGNDDTPEKRSNKLRKKRAVLRSVLIAKKLQLRRKSHHNDNDNDKSPVVLDTIDGKTLKKVIEYCKYHYDVPHNPTLDEDAVIKSLNDFDAKFVKNVDRTTFFNLIQAAHDLKITTLLDLTCGTLSNMIKGKNYEEFVETLVTNWR